MSSDDASTGGPTADGTADGPDDDGHDRSLTWWPIAGALAIALLVAAAIFFFGAGQDNHIGTKTESDGSLTCPPTYQITKASTGPKATKGWVPVTPSGVDGAKSLVPDAQPSHASVCRYPAPADAAATELNLGGQITITSGLRDITRDLATSPSVTSGSTPCGEGGPSFLLGLTFATGVDWVSVPYCGGLVSNGEFVTSRNLTQIFTRAFDAQAWPTSQP